MEAQIAYQPSERFLGANTSTKDDLLQRAKDAIEAGEQSLHDAAEALAEAQEVHGTSQAEMARAIGKSVAWVSYLLQWRRQGYKGDSPFGPKTKAGRLKHAEDRATTGASKPRKARKASTRHRVDAGNAHTSVENREVESARKEADAETTAPSNTQTAKSAKALTEFKYAVKVYLPLVDNTARQEAIEYFHKKMGVPLP